MALGDIGGVPGMWTDLVRLPGSTLLGADGTTLTSLVPDFGGDYPPDMDDGMGAGVNFGALVRQYREARGLGVDGLCAAIGGTPGPGFLTSLEAGAIGPSSSLVLRLAEALDLPADLMLNAAGFTTERQRTLALATLAAGEPPSG